MHIGGTLVSGVVRILVVVATLAAAYYFILRPILDTTEKVSGGISNNIQKSLDEANEAFSHSNVTPQTQNQITTSIKNVPPDRLPRLNTCIQRNPTSIAHIERCAKRLSKKN
jgi:NAD-specific glutamate dehydrogenase